MTLSLRPLRRGALLALAALVPAAAAAARADELREKARAGDAAAQLELADACLFGRNGRRVNPVLAAYWYRQAAAQGSAEGEYNLGCCYEFGWGVEKCRHEALSLYTRAAKRGLMAAAVRRAHLICKGIPAEALGEVRFDELPADREAGVRELRRCGDAGYAPAKLELAMLLHEDRKLREKHAEEIGRLAREAAESPHAPLAAKLFYARCLRHGTGVVPDPARALELYREAAEKGAPAAMAAYGRMLEFGMGAPPDPARALELYREAAEKGDPSGMLFLGERLMAEDRMAEAYGQFAEAAKLDYAPACVKAGDCLASGWGVAADPKAAFELYERAAKLGDATAQYKLGKCFADGIGTARDPAAAVFWYKCAGASGDRDAVRELGAALFRGQGVPADPAEGRRLLEAAVRAGDREAAEILNGGGAR